MDNGTSIELEQFIEKLEDFNQQRQFQFSFIKESILNGEYLINPKVIASKWLNTCFQVEQETCTFD